MGEGGGLLPILYKEKNVRGARMHVVYALLAAIVSVCFFTAT